MMGRVSKDVSFTDINTINKRELSSLLCLPRRFFVSPFVLVDYYISANCILMRALITWILGGKTSIYQTKSIFFFLVF